MLICFIKEQYISHCLLYERRSVYSVPDSTSMMLNIKLMISSRKHKVRGVMQPITINEVITIN